MSKPILFATAMLMAGIGCPAILFGQYNGETVTEKSFEQSGLYFTSHFLNPFGVPGYRDVAVGLIDDPFLNLQLNPASLSQFTVGSTHLYLDFRSDRSESAIVADYGGIIPLRYYGPYYPIIIDPRWYSNTRSEPEPVFSLGLLTYPLGNKNRRLFLGGTYQIIHKEELFYTVPAWIYQSRFGYDPLGNLVVEDQNIPITDRYSGADEMVTTGHLFSGFLGYRLSSKLSAGVSLNGVIHSREGNYLNAYQDEYGQINDWDSRYLNFRERSQEYDHLDAAGGLQFDFSSNASAGIKAGYLQGNADQTYTAVDSSKYDYLPSGNPNQWSYNGNRSVTGQSWNQEGKNWYGRVHFSGKINPEAKARAYYQYSKTEIDLANASAISDTGYYDSRWVWDDTVVSRYYSHYSLADQRSGRGTREKSLHQAMLNLEWQLTPKNTVLAGVYYSRENSTVSTLEPVLAERFSEYFHYNSVYDPDTSYYLSRLAEDKELEWNYRSNYWTVQVPILARFQFNEHWSMMLGINRILKSWDIEEQTTAYFTRREKTENGQTRVETNFGERYTQPRQRITEDATDFISSFEVAISPKFRINLLVDPAFEDEFRIAQWWLSFRANL